jgi:hypothetical protein
MNDIPTIIFCAGRKCTTTCPSFQGTFFFFLFSSLEFFLISFDLQTLRCRLFPIGILKIWSPENPDIEVDRLTVSVYQ